MKKKLLKILFVVLCICLCGFVTACGGGPLEANEVFEQSKKSVGEIVTYDKNNSELSLGTCFVLSEDGKFVTNYHVIEDAYSAKITLSDKTYDVKSVLAYDKDIDLIVLKVDASNLPVSEISYEIQEVGKAAYAFGSSRGLTATFSQGIITAVDREIDGVKYVQHDAAISNGNSGGPLINEYGKIIGVNTFTIKDSQNLNFAISISELNNLVYGTTLTVSQLYDKEFNSFVKLKNYVVSEGTYDASDKQYDLNFGFAYYDDLAYRTGVYYDVEDQEVVLNLFITDGDLSMMVFICIDEIDGVYEWSYIDGYSRFMLGNIYGSSFNSNSTLYYTSYSGISSASLRLTIADLATSMVKILLNEIEYDYVDIGLTAKDLGFLYF